MTEPADKPAPPAIDLAGRRAARDAPSAWSQDAYAPLVTSGPAVDALRARLSAIAVELGHPPEIQQRVEVRSAGFHRALLEPNVTVVRLQSPTFMAGGDARQLGVAVVEVQVDGAVVPLTDLRLQQGFHDIDGGLRWTDGDAYIVLDPAPHPRVLRLRVVAAKPDET